MKIKTLKTRGRNHEKAVAVAFDGERHKGVSGCGREDVCHDIFSIECKERATSYAHGFMAQAVRNSPAGKIPMVVIKRFNTPFDENLVCLRQRDFLELFKIVI
jgi:hypothetical protein